ncbi:MAG: RIP metalloprotease RseP [Candidatus Pacebacteria bacterium]|nr:RIP metalloprotease RseP [Candidatus Paceibacterota bacterium]
MTIILFLVILAVLVFVHELGHFVAAKAFGIRVDEFAIGFPPKIFGWQKGETKYSLNLIPFGGYVKIFGENPDDESLTGSDSSRSFVNAKRWKQAIVLLAGIFMNLVFAWILISISFNIGLTTSITDEYKDKAKDVAVMVLSVQENSPAEKSGIKGGDYILSIKSGDVFQVSPNVEFIQKTITESKDKIIIEYKRNSATGTVEVVSQNGVVEGKKAIGISMGMVGTVEFGFFQSFYEGAKLMAIETKSITIGLYSFITGIFRAEEGLFSQVAGPIGIANMVGEARNIGLSYLLGFVAMISINLAMLNLIPFPALDGGRTLFVIIEAIIRRRIKPVILNWVNGIGFLLLIVLMVVVTFKDILRLL